MNTYAAYHVLYTGTDSSGMQEDDADDVPRVSENPPYCPCICISIDINFSNADGWDTYSWSVLEGGETQRKRHLGNKITSTFNIWGDPDECEFYQDEAGSFMRTIAVDERLPRDNDEGNFPFPAADDARWTEIVTGVDGNRITEEGGGRSGKAEVWEEDRVVFTDHMGITQGTLAANKTTHLWIQLDATSRCVSSDGTELTKSWQWHGKTTVYVGGVNARPNQWRSRNTSVSSNPDVNVDEEDQE